PTLWFWAHIRRCQVKIDIVQIEVGMLLNFVEFLIEPGGGAAVVDPAYEVDRLLRMAREHDWKVQTVLVTHSHHDHIDGVAELCAATGAVVRVGAGEAEAVAAAAPAARIEPVTDGEPIPLGAASVTALSTPGHTVDGMSYLAGGAVI